ncbi:MAG: PTS sugar transporter subunit IIA [Chromatiales bacterium]|nr:PTS sugar transporter subunit IIA [Chromatiales bacterium]
MNQLADLLSPGRVSYCGTVSSKKRALELISELMVSEDIGLSASEVFASLIERERLGSTGLGHGAAIPHGRLKGLDHAVCAFLKIGQGVAYEASDGKPVNMICGLLVPQQSTTEHLNILALLAEMFSDSRFCARIHEARTGKEIYDLLVSWRPAADAASLEKAEKATGSSA